MHSEMGPVRQNPIQRTVRTAHLSVLMTVSNVSTQYSTEQNSSDNLPSYLQTTIIAQVLSIGGKVGVYSDGKCTVLLLLLLILFAYFINQLIL